MKKILVFPYHPDIHTLLNYKDTLIGFSIVGVCSYKEDCFITEKINKTLGGPETYDEQLDACDALLILDNYRNYKYDKYYEIIQLAWKRKKELLITPKVCSALDMSKISSPYTLLEHTPHISSERFKKLEYLPTKKYVIETPISAVLGMGQNCGKFEVQLLLKHFLEKNGYRPVWMSSNPLGALWGGYTFPEFIYSNQLAFEEKILKLNDFMYRLSLLEHPDIFIIGIPEGISEFRVDEFNHFGEYPLVIGSALSVDSAIFCTYFMDPKNIAGIESLCNHCLTKFNIPVHALSIGNTIFEAIEGSNKIEYSFLDKNYVDTHYSASISISIPVFPIWDRTKVEDALQVMLQRLENNADAI